MTKISYLKFYSQGINEKKKKKQYIHCYIIIVKNQKIDKLPKLGD